MKVSEYIAWFLAEQKVLSVFELSGGMIAHMLDALNSQGRVRVTSVHHEQSAAFAADAVGRLTGTPGVAMATSGPGATNLLTGIGSCYFDSSPAVFITGQVNRNEQKHNRLIRQFGFQELDIVSMARPITKAAWLVQTAEETPDLLTRAFQLAIGGRPGPVLLDIPMDVQRSEIRVSDVPKPKVETPDSTPFDEAGCGELLDQMDAAHRPLILIGGGVRAAMASELLRAFVRKVQVPVVNSLMALDVLPYDDPQRVGMIGSYGNRWANLAIGRADFLLVLGSRLDVRQTGSETQAFKGDRVIFHVDCEEGEINNRVVGCKQIVAHLKVFLSHALAMLKDRELLPPVCWLAEIDGLRRKHPDTAELAGIEGINPNLFMHQLSAVSAKASAYVVDVGQHQMWAAQSLELQADQRFLTSGGMGSMGFALPAAIGAALVDIERPVLVIAGDGGFQSNIQELQTVVRNRLPIKMVIIDNGCHGMVRQFQEKYFDSRYQSTLWGYSAPDFTGVAKGYGIRAARVDSASGVEKALKWLWREPNKPALLQVVIDTYANAYPKISFGKPITEMESFVKQKDSEQT